MLALAFLLLVTLAPPASSLCQVSHQLGFLSSFHHFFIVRTAVTNTPHNLSARSSSVLLEVRSRWGEGPDLRDALLGHFLSFLSSHFVIG